MIAYQYNKLYLYILGCYCYKELELCQECEQYLQDVVEQEKQNWKCMSHFVKHDKYMYIHWTIWTQEKNAEKHTLGLGVVR